jgi:hypothetical protein
MARHLTAKRLLVLGSVLLVAAVLIDLRPWRWTVPAGHPVLLGVGLPGAALLVGAAVVHRRRRASADPSSGPWLLSYAGLLTVTAVVAVVGVTGLVIMLLLAAAAPAAARPALQIDAIKYGLGIFAAGGAAAALLLAVRRQRHAEQAQAHTELDAAERRVTDLYTKAVEQLGHADAAVRLGGLYALERVAQNNVDQRQTVVNVLCAYLRMPYEPPGDAEPAPSAGEGRDPRQELQVRLATQLIITDHVARPPGTDPLSAGRAAPDARQPFWPGIDLDLAGATLVNWKMRHGHVRNAWFGGTSFAGGARFDEAAFTGDARFEKAGFAGGAVFNGATFTARALFTGVTFTAGAWFDDATFAGDAWFTEGAFAGGARFGGVTFAGDTRFDKAVFAGGARFTRAAFGAGVAFTDAAFAGSARFGGATFTGTARFLAATFAKSPELTPCRVASGSPRHDSWPPHWRVVSAADGSGTLVHEPPSAG